MEISIPPSAILTLVFLLQIATKCQNNYLFHLMETLPSPPQHIPIESVKIFHLVILNLSKTVQHPQIITLLLQPGVASTWTAAAFCQGLGTKSCQNHQKHARTKAAAGNGAQTPGFNSGLGAMAAQIDTVMPNGQSKPLLVNFTKYLSSDRSASKLSVSFVFP